MSDRCGSLRWGEWAPKLLCAEWGGGHVCTAFSLLFYGNSENSGASVLAVLGTPIEQTKESRAFAATSPFCTDKPYLCYQYAINVWAKKTPFKKVAGPDDILPRLLWLCVFDLALAFSGIFNLSLNHFVVPDCLKRQVIVPLVKKCREYRQVTVTSVAIKCSENYFITH